MTYLVSINKISGQRPLMSRLGKEEMTAEPCWVKIGNRSSGQSRIFQGQSLPTQSDTQRVTRFHIESMTNWQLGFTNCIDNTITIHAARSLITHRSISSYIRRNHKTAQVNMSCVSRTKQFCVEKLSQNVLNMYINKLRGFSVHYLELNNVCIH